MGGLEHIPAAIGREAGYTLDGSPVCRRADTETVILSYSYSHVWANENHQPVGGGQSTHTDPANSTQKDPDHMVDSKPANS